MVIKLYDVPIRADNVTIDLDTYCDVEVTPEMLAQDMSLEFYQSLKGYFEDGQAIMPLNDAVQLQKYWNTLCRAERWEMLCDLLGVSHVASAEDVIETLKKSL